MKKVTRTLALLLTLCTLLSCLSIFVSADSVVSTEKKDVTASTASVLKSIQADSTLSDSDKIQQIVTLLFDAKREQLANTNLADFDFSIFGELSALQYFSRSVKAQKETYKGLNLSLNNCQTELTFESIEIDTNTALVKVYEWFSFYYSTSPNIESGEGFDYAITLQKNTTNWEITNIDFDNEATKALRDPSIDIAAFVQNRCRVANTVTPGELVSTFGDNSAVSPRSTTSSVTLSISKFVAYALQYDGSARNPNFMDCTTIGGDCQNFASQCIWAGLSGETSSLSSAGTPMINPTLAGSTGREWYIFPNGTHSASWTSCTNFANYISSGGTTTLGLYGHIFSGVLYADAGDLIQIRDSSGSYSHTYVVVYVTGEAGERTPADIYVSAHTYDRAYELLSTIVDDPNVYRTIRVRRVNL